MQNRLNTWRPETIKCLAENKGSKHFYTGLRDGFLALTPKAKATKAKINKWDYMNKGHYQQNEKTNPQN